MSDVVRLDPSAPLEVDPDHPAHRGATQFVGADTAFTAGIWAADDGTVEIAAHAVDEVCVVLAGTITVTTADGVQVFTAGDAFAIRRGAAMRWQQSDGTRKVFVTLDPR